MPFVPAVTAVTSVAGLGLAAKQAKDAKKEQQRAAAQQAQAGEQAIQRQEEAAALGLPFIEAGTSQLPLLQNPNETLNQDIIDLTNSPLFEANFGLAKNRIEGELANQGLLGSGTGSLLLDQARLSSLAPLLQQRNQDRFRLAQLGQASAAGQVAPAAQIGNIQTGVGAANAASTIAGGNARRQGVSDIVSQLPGAVSAVGGLFNRNPIVNPPANTQVDLATGALSSPIAQTPFFSR